MHFESKPVCTLDRDALRQVLQAHQALGISLHYSVGFLCRVQGIELRDAAQAAGFSRGLVYLALKGDRRVPDRLRQSFEQLLGIDPWLVAEAGR